MAGRRQHFIPRFLLRRFADEREQVRVMPQGREPFVASVGNVGHERDFFGPPGPSTADDAITREEAPVLAALQRVDASRQMLQPDMIRATAEAVVRNDSKSIRRQALDEVRRRLGVAAFRRLQTGPQWPTVLRRLDQLMVEGAEQLDSRGIAEALQQGLLGVRAGIDSQVARVHEQAAASEPTPAARREKFAAFGFTVASVDADLILGDSMAWGLGVHTSAVPLHSVDDDLSAIFLPIGRRAVLVGRRGVGHAVDAAKLNVGAALASHEFIVGHPTDRGADRLASLIGAGKASALNAGIEHLRATLRSGLLSP